MSWASRRRTIYVSGIVLFFGTLIGVPVAYKIITIPPTCHDGIQNQGETAPDRGGPCLLLDDRLLSPHAVMWARSFRVRTAGTASTTSPGGTYNAIAYIENPNEHAGVMRAPYRFSLFDKDRVLVAVREGYTYIMPSGITPVFAGGIDTGNRDVAHVTFEFTDPLVWEWVNPAVDGITVANIQSTDLDTVPHIAAVATNGSAAPALGVVFVITVFDRSGNAIASSATTLNRLDSGDSQTIVFTWPDPLSATIGKIEILPILPPKEETRALR